MTLLGQNEAIEEADIQREAAGQRLREEREELEERLREFRLQELNAGAEMRAEWPGWPGRGLTVSIGLEEVQWLTADARQSGGVLVRKEVKQGLVCFNYKPDTPVKWFSESAVVREGLRWAGVPIMWNGRNWWKQQQILSLRKDCRGVVVAEDGQVVARPVQRFFKVTDLWEIEDNGEGWQKVVAVTEKLDGEMLVGVLVGEAVELWSRGGWTEQAVSATRHANSVVGLCGLVSEVYERGGSPTFEYIGKQSLVKVRYKETDLVLVAIRDRETGKWWEYSQLQS